jgi:hypothetical protein
MLQSARKRSSVFPEVPGPTETKPAFFDSVDLAASLTLVNCALSPHLTVTCLRYYADIR